MESTFFEGLEIKKREIRGGTVEVPVRYQQVFAVGGIFTAPVLPLQKLLPTSKLVPAEIIPGKGLLAVMAFDYRESSIGPYREVGIAVPARYRPRMNPPLFPALRMSASLSYEAYIWKLPVTTEIALRAGIDVWGYPKFMGEIEFTEDDEQVSCRLSEEGRHILTLTVRKFPTRLKTYFDLNTWTVKDDELLFTCIKGISSSLGRTFTPGRARLELGEDHPVSRTIREIAPGRSVHALYIPGAKIILPEAEQHHPL
jgi:hypothetical protein